MKQINISIDDELYRQARERLDDLESSVSRCVTDYLQSLNDDDARIAAARNRMIELFRNTKGFGVGEKLSREEMHERGSVH
jgi:tetrahydromethanopterin S-methyltransferase subunit G